jgi:hypothetical protein
MTNSADQSAARVPDFFIIGQPKSGTTALYEMLRRHPQIFMPERKEPVYLASDLHAGLWATVPSRPRTLADYLALFAPARADQRVGEASTPYLWSHTAAANIAELAPRARVIAIMREPASFPRSLHLQLLQNHIETENNLGRAIALEPARRDGRQLPDNCLFPEALMYSERLAYVEQLRRYDRQLAREQMLVLAYDDFWRDNEATVRKVLQFLDVADDVPMERLEANPTVRVRSKRLEDLLRVAPLGTGSLARVAKSAVKSVTSRRLRHSALRLARRRVLYTQPPPADDEVMLGLRRRFKGEVVALSDYLGRDLVSLWGYGDID